MSLNVSWHNTIRNNTPVDRYNGDSTITVIIASSNGADWINNMLKNESITPNRKTKNTSNRELLFSRNVIIYPLLL